MADSPTLQQLFPAPGSEQARLDAYRQQPHHRNIIVVGDPTTHGGMVVSGSPTHSYHGRAVARKGDWVECPQLYPNDKPHGSTQIVEGDEQLRIDGQAVALDGHHAQCGCALIADPYTLNPNAPLRMAPYPIRRDTEWPNTEENRGLKSNFQPDMQRLAHEPVVRQGIETAWNQSLSDHLEHGFWILRDPATNALSLDWWPTGAEGYVYRSPRPDSTIASFHVHPPLSLHALQRAAMPPAQSAPTAPSAADVLNSVSYNKYVQSTPGMVRSTSGMYYHGPKPDTPLYTDGKTPYANQSNYTNSTVKYWQAKEVEVAPYVRKLKEKMKEIEKLKDAQEAQNGASPQKGTTPSA